MVSLRFSLAFGLIFGLLALGNADQLESFLIGRGLPLANNGLKVNINKLIDENIELIRDVLKKFDPTQLPDVSLLGKGQLTRGWLSVLSQMRRTGDSSFTYDDKILTVDIKFGWELLKYDFDYAYKLWFIQRSGQLHGSVEKLEVNLKLHVDLKNYAIVLQEFKLGNVGKLSLKLEGSFGDKIRSWIGGIILKVAKKPIMYAVEGVVSKTIQEKINELNKQISNEKRQFIFINLAKLNDGNTYWDENDVEVDIQ